MSPSENPYYNLSQPITILTLLYFDEPERFEINDETSFTFIPGKHKFAYHLLGKKSIHRRGK